MATLIDLFKEFHRNATQQEYPPSSRVLYYTLLGEFNSARWPDSLVLSTRDLTQLTGLPTTSVHRAKQFLTSKGIIKCRPFKNKTAFSLPTEQSRNSNGTVAEQSRNSNGTLTEQSRNTFENPNIHVREEDVKTLDVSSSVSQSGACACAFNWNPEIEARLTDLWVKNRGVPVSFELLSYFKSLVDKHGLTFVEDVIREAAFGYDGDYNMSGKYLRGCVERKLKGGDTNVRVARQPERVREDGHRRSNVVDFATGTRQAGKGRFDDDEPDTAWVYESQSANSGTAES